MAKTTKKTKKDFEVWANKQLKDIQKILLTHDYQLDPIKSAGDETTSHSVYRYPYKDIEIAYADSIFDFWSKGNVDDAYRVLLHEMIHPITDKLYGVGYDRFASKSQIENEREQLTDHFTNVIFNLIKKK